VRHKLFLDLARIGPRFIHLIDGDDDSAVRGFGVADGFDGLRHDAIIRGDDENDNIRHRSAASAHGREGGVPRSVDDGDLFAFVFFLIGADGLANAARLVACDIAMTDGVDEGRFAMVDVAHDGHDWRSFDEIFRIVVNLQLVKVLLIHHDLFLEVVVELQADGADGFVIEHLVDGDGLPLHEEEFDDGGRGKR
jgi:hypothetical protein